MAQSGQELRGALLAEKEDSKVPRNEDYLQSTSCAGWLPGLFHPAISSSENQNSDGLAHLLEATDIVSETTCGSNLGARPYSALCTALSGKAWDTTHKGSSLRDTAVDAPYMDLLVINLAF